MKTTIIRLTYVSPEYDGISNELFMDKTVLLRNARHAGDVETVNNFVLGRLRYFKNLNILDYEKL